MNSFLANALHRKPLHVVREQAHMSELTQCGSNVMEQDISGPPPEVQEGSRTPRRHMNLFDLLAFGVGCTIGSGVFVLAGLTANQYAGPSASLSYFIAGLVAAMSGLPYAELSASFPLDGSTYEYAYVSLGEIFAVIASLCQTLEYGGSAAAVARSWGEKFVDWVKEGDGANEDHFPKWVDTILDPGYGINPMAAIISVITSLLLLWGVRESKIATNAVSTIKVSLILFMIVGGFVLASGVVPEDSNNLRPASFSNWKPFVPPEYGVSGIIRGSSIVFFAFIGFDQVCNLSGETQNPVKDVPKAVVLTLLIDGFLYMLAALSLTAMVPYDQISSISGFPRAFGVNGWVWAEKISAIGEILTLPLVVLTATQSQSRLLFAMSKDKLVPSLFGRIKTAKTYDGKEKIGNLSDNLKVCGITVVIIATFIPFEYMDDMISAGVLFLFALTDSCLLTVRYTVPSESFLGEEVAEKEDSVRSFLSILGLERKYTLSNLLAMMSAFSFASGLSFAYCNVVAVRAALTSIFAILSCVVTLHIAWNFPEAHSTHFVLESDGYGNGRPRFRTPFVPYLPSLGIFLSLFMLAHIEWVGLLLLLGYLMSGVVLYIIICCGKTTSLDINTNGNDATAQSQMKQPSALLRESLI